jgi:hypothetical protein
MKLEEIKSKIELKLNKGLPAHIFLDRMRLIDEGSRQSLAYNNATYVPFYYWLGTILESKTLVEVGFRLGLLSGNFLKSCKTVNYFLALQEVKVGEFYSDRIGKSNIKDHYKGNFFVHTGYYNEDVFTTKLRSLDIDLVIMNEEVGYDKHRLYYDLVWPQMAKDGIIVVDYLNKYKPSLLAFNDFCRSVNREPVYVNTDYGVGIIKK